MNEPAGLAAGSVDRERNAHGSLHEEAVQDSAVIAVVVKSVDEALVLDGLRGVRSPDDALVEVGDAERVILLVELEEEGIKALSGVIDRARVCWVKNVGLASSREDNVDVTLGDFAAGRAVAIDAHGTEVDDVGVDLRVNDSAAKIVRPPDIVVDSVPLGLRRLHRVGSGPLLGEVHDGVGLLFLDQLDQEVVLFRNIEVDELDILARNLLPCLDANL